MFSSRLRPALAFCAITVLLNTVALAKPITPANLGNGLDKLVTEQTDRSSLQTTLRAQSDEQGRVLVRVHLDGTVPLAQVKQQLQSMGLNVTDQATNYRKGVLFAYLPLDQANAVGQLPGVRAVLLAPMPFTQVGAVTSQGAVVHKTTQLNSSGISGQGITIGAMSDSYNKSSSSIKASDDVASGDLPGVGNPINSQPVVVLQDFPIPKLTSDEGRGMLQLITDLAPKAKLCFATAFTSFATNIINLADPAKGCNADIIVDDVIVSDEPMFSDGLIAQAVDDVTQGLSFPGKKVAYFSSAGNQSASQSYDGSFKPVTDAAARAGLVGENLKLTSVPTSLTSGGFHNFGTSKAPAISQSVTIPSGSTSISFQWNDPFDVLPTGVTTDYNILFFLADGTPCPSSGTITCTGGTNDNFASNEPVELISLTNGGTASATIQVVITRKGTTPTIPTAERIRYVAINSGLSISEFVNYAAPSTFGHATANGANGVAAYVYTTTPGVKPFVPAVEGFTATGPITIYFDTAGNRYDTPRTRSKPEFAAVDGTDTTFFPPGPLSATDYDNNGFPNFFGTSAAAPHAAAVAALVLQAAGGPGSLTPDQLSTYLKQSAPAHDLDPNFSKTITTVGTTRLRVAATGDGSSSFDPNFFSVLLKGDAGEALTELTIDLSGAGLVFDPSTTTGLPFTVGSSEGNVGVTSQLIGTNKLKLSFTSFGVGDSISFGIDRDLAATNSGGNGADLVGGATVSAKTVSAGTITGTFANVIRLGYSQLDGYGLLDASAAVKLLP